MTSIICIHAQVDHGVRPYQISSPATVLLFFVFCFQGLVFVLILFSCVTGVFFLAVCRLVSHGEMKRTIPESAI